MRIKEKGLKKRARKILGLSLKAEIDIEEIKRRFRQKTKEYHPDTDTENKSLNKKFKLIVQAKNYLAGKEKNPALLEDDNFIEEFLGEPVEKLGKSFKEWMQYHFYDFENKSIWPTE